MRGEFLPHFGHFGGRGSVGIRYLSDVPGERTFLVQRVLRSPDLLRNALLAPFEYVIEMQLIHKRVLSELSLQISYEMLRGLQLIF
jgi:hypothetical protein